MVRVTSGHFIIVWQPCPSCSHTWVCSIIW